MEKAKFKNNMGKNKKKLFSTLIFVSLALLAIVFFAQKTQAQSSVPQLETITDVRVHLIVLPIKSEIFQDKSVVAMVTIESTSAKEVIYRELDVRFNENGESNVNIAGLDAGTKYKFKVSLREQNSKEFSADSNPQEATTNE